MTERIVIMGIATTGFAPESERVVELAMVELDHGRPTGRSWHQWFNPDMAMPEEAYEVHGLTTEFLLSKPRFGDLATAILAFIDGATLVAHHAGFDMGMLNAELERSGRPERLGAISLASVARRRTTIDPPTIDALCQHYRIPLVGRVEKGALLDAQLLAELWRKLMAERPLGDDERELIYRHGADDGLALSPFSGIEDFINETLGHRIDHRQTWLQLARWKLPVDFGALIDGIYQRMVSNWTRCQSLPIQSRSAENWRWCEPKTTLAEHNPSKEVTLERRFIQAVAARGDWANQVPVASGIGGSANGRRRAIDLVHRRGDGAFDFIELKIASDNPLFAAFEIIQYGMMWLLSRKHDQASELLAAHDIRLSVLAPRDYYGNLETRWLSAALDEGLRALGKREGVALGFVFERFPDGFNWSPKEGMAPADLCAAFDGRLPLEV